MKSSELVDLPAVFLFIPAILIMGYVKLLCWIWRRHKNHTGTLK